jgi:hypothetical protein
LGLHQLRLAHASRDFGMDGTNNANERANGERMARYRTLRGCTRQTCLHYSIAVTHHLCAAAPMVDLADVITVWGRREKFGQLIN